MLYVDKNNNIKLTRGDTAKFVVSVQNDRNANDFPAAVKLGDRPVGIGDTYTDGKFYRDGVEVLTPMEQAQAEMTEYKAALHELGVETEESV